MTDNIFWVSALGTEIGVEIEDGVFVEPDSAAETVLVIEPVEADTDDEDNKEENTIEETDFICPGAGFHPSDTNCADYYQCTEEKTVDQPEPYSVYIMIPFSDRHLFSTVLTGCSTTLLSVLATGRSLSSVRSLQMSPSIRIESANG